MVTPVFPARELARTARRATDRAIYDRRIGDPEHRSIPRRASRAAPVAALRGAEVGADPGRVVRVLVAVTLTTLGVVSAILFVAGAHKNAQIDELRSHGIKVEVTVSSCLGLLGGSGSNAAGYACRGSYEVSGRQFVEAIPGRGQRTPGATVVGVVSPRDPRLLSTPAQIRADRSSWRVFITPAVLALALLGALAAVLTGWRARRRVGSYMGGV